jgi:hypothetical protein
MITPSAMTIPILPIVLPNPSFIDFMMVSRFIPERIPKNSATNNKAKNGCKCHFAVRKIRNMTLAMSNKNDIISEFKI